MTSLFFPNLEHFTLARLALSLALNDRFFVGGHVLVQPIEDDARISQLILVFLRQSERFHRGSQHARQRGSLFSLVSDALIAGLLGSLWVKLKLLGLS